MKYYVYLFLMLCGCGSAAPVSPSPSVTPGSPTSSVSPTPSVSARVELEEFIDTEEVLLDGMVDIPGGTFMLGRCVEGEDVLGCNDYYPYLPSYPQELPEVEVTVSSFKLDIYEISVGWYRKFWKAYNEGWRPPEDRWNPKWSEFVEDDDGKLIMFAPYKPELWNWTAQPEGKENYPMGNFNWYKAKLYCLWRGKRLPTTEEWEYAAAGGQENRLYPWGSEDPCEGKLANIGCTDNRVDLPVDSHPEGVSLYGNYNMAGSLWEWTSTEWTGWVHAPPNPGATFMTMRGGQFQNASTWVRSVYSMADYSDLNGYYHSVRCAL